MTFSEMKERWQLCKISQQRKHFDRHRLMANNGVFPSSCPPPRCESLRRRLEAAERHPSCSACRHSATNTILHRPALISRRADSVITEVSGRRRQPGNSNYLQGWDEEPAGSSKARDPALAARPKSSGAEGRTSRRRSWNTEVTKGPRESLLVFTKGGGVWWAVTRTFLITLSRLFNSHLSVN